MLGLQRKEKGEEDKFLIKFMENFKMAKRKKRRGGRSIGRASRACPMYSKKTGKRIRSKSQRKRCMQRYLSGGKSGRKRKVKKRRKRRK